MSGRFFTREIVEKFKHDLAASDYNHVIPLDWQIQSIDDVVNSRGVSNAMEFYDVTQTGCIDNSVDRRGIVVKYKRDILNQLYTQYTSGQIDALFISVENKVRSLIIVSYCASQNIWIVELICLGQLDCALCKMMAPILMGAYLYCIKLSDRWTQRGLLEVAKYFDNLAAFCFYNKFGFTIDYDYFGYTKMALILQEHEREREREQSRAQDRKQELEQIQKQKRAPATNKNTRKRQKGGTQPCLLWGLIPVSVLLEHIYAEDIMDIVFGRIMVCKNSICISEKNRKSYDDKRRNRLLELNKILFLLTVSQKFNPPQSIMEVIINQIGFNVGYFTKIAQSHTIQSITQELDTFTDLLDERNPDCREVPTSFPMSGGNTQTRRRRRRTRRHIRRLKK